MLLKHTRLVVRPLTLPDSLKPGPFSSQVKPADAGEQGKMREFHTQSSYGLPRLQSHVLPP